MTTRSPLLPLAALFLGACTKPTEPTEPAVKVGPTEDGEAYFIGSPPPIEASAAPLDIEPGFDAFVMAENAKSAGQPSLRDDSAAVDPVFYERVVASMRAHAFAWDFWRELEKIKDDYAYVVSELGKAGMPTVFAAIPYWESRYRPNARSYVCAQGYWQLMPETAKRVGVNVQNCKLRGREGLWNPTQLTPAPISRSEYVAGASSCLIQTCEVDERSDLAKSTRGAIQLLREAWDNEVIQRSSAAVQITILAHNAGFNDKPKSGLLHFYNQHLEATGQSAAPDFYGQNIKCAAASHAAEAVADKCGSLLWNQTQHYAYNVVAEHLLAVCYYAKNHGEEPAFAAWKSHLEGYCSAIEVPSRDGLYKKAETPPE